MLLLGCIDRHETGFMQHLAGILADLGGKSFPNSNLLSKEPESRVVVVRPVIWDRYPGVRHRLAPGIITVDY